MANTVSALKRVRMTERRTGVNRTRKTRLRHQIRAMRRLLESKDAKGATELVPEDLLRDRPRRQVGHHQEEHGSSLQEPSDHPDSQDRHGLTTV